MWAEQEDIDERVKLDRENFMRPQSYTKNYKQLKEAGNERGALPQGRVLQLAVQCQMVLTENISTDSIIQT